MKLCLLHLDDALPSQGDFISHCERNGATHLHAEKIGSAIRLWGKEPCLQELSAVLHGKCRDLGAGPKLWFMGSGDFHHVSALHIAHAVEEAGEPVTVIHFDNHPDWVHFSGGMHCGSWVNRATNHPNVAKVITLGVTSYDLKNPEWRGANLSLMREGKLELFPYWHAPSRVRKQYGTGPGYTQKQGRIHWHSIAEAGEGPFLATLLSRIGTRMVYLTIDKDVLAHDDALTNWDQGRMSLAYLLQIIAAIGAAHRIIGADVTGDYSPPHYSGNIVTRFMKRAEIFTDQPRSRPSLEEAARVNSASNHALLDALQEVMA